MPGIRRCELGPGREGPDMLYVTVNISQLPPQTFRKRSYVGVTPRPNEKAPCLTFSGRAKMVPGGEDGERN